MKIVISIQSFHVGMDRLKRGGYQVVTNDKGKRLDESELTNMMDDQVIGIIAGGEKITKRVMDSACNLKAISRVGIGVDNIDMDYARERGINVLTVSSHINAVAEHTLALILTSLKNITKDKREIGYLLKGKTVGIVGYGRVGQRLEELLVPFGLTILRCDTVRKDIYKYTSLEELLKKSDIISIHCPLTKQTAGMFDFKEFRLMKENVLLVNTARAEIVNEDALIEAVKSKSMRVALDVVNHPERFRFRGLEVIITPHTASYTIETRKQMEKDAMNKLLRAI